MYYVKTTLGEQPWLDGEPVLVSAGVAWNNPGEGFTLEPPEDPESLFVDSGGYQVTVHFGGEYPYSPEELFEYAEEIGADYVAGMDWACEDAESLACLYDDLEPEDILPVEERLQRTVDKQIEQLEVYESREWPFEFVPAVQGLEPDQYRWCARQLRLHDLARPYMAIGTVCKREDPDGILEVVEVLEEELPATEWHLFGATKEIWNDRRFRTRFASADSHAWAMKTPEDEWTKDNEDKKRAFEHWSADIEAIRDEMAEQSTLGTADGGRRMSPALRAIGARRCVCGTLIPAYRTEFEPGCRHCETTALNRWDAALADAEQGPDPTRKYSEDDQTTID